MASSTPLLLALACLAQIWRAYGGEFDDFNLEDALDFPTKKPTPKPPKTPKKPSGGTDDSLWDIIQTTTKKPRSTKAPQPPPKKPGKNPSDFDLADALDDNNDNKGGKPRPGTGGEFSDQDLNDALSDGYRPDKNKGGGYGGGGSAGSDSNSDSNAAETGTIAGIASALAMALIGAVTSYISYQQKKFCFSIQQGLNAEYVKGETMEAVVSEEPQVKYTCLESQSAEPPKQESAKV